MGTAFWPATSSAGGQPDRSCRASTMTRPRRTASDVSTACAPLDAVAAVADATRRWASRRLPPLPAAGLPRPGPPLQTRPPPQSRPARPAQHWCALAAECLKRGGLGRRGRRIALVVKAPVVPGEVEVTTGGREGHRVGRGGTRPRRRCWRLPRGYRVAEPDA